MPTRFFFWPPAPELEIPPAYVGVMVQKLSATRWHVGVLYRTSQSAATILHLMGHYDLRRDPPSDGHFCILSPIEPARVLALATTFNRLYRAHKDRGSGIPYGFTPPTFDFFSQVQQLVPGQGLCCQTFVQKAYQTAGIELLEPLEAPQREDDVARQNGLLDEWNQQIQDSQNPQTVPHFQAVRNSVGTPLYRPLEVGGAALADNLPCNFEMTFELAKKVSDEIEKFTATQI